MNELEQVEAGQAAPGYHDNKDAVLKRLRRVEGQGARPAAPGAGGRVMQAIARLMRT